MDNMTATKIYYDTTDFFRLWPTLVEVVAL